MRPPIKGYYRRAGVISYVVGLGVGQVLVTPWLRARGWLP